MVDTPQYPGGNRWNGSISSGPAAVVQAAVWGLAALLDSFDDFGYAVGVGVEIADANSRDRAHVHAGARIGCPQPDDHVVFEAEPECGCHGLDFSLLGGLAHEFQAHVEEGAAGEFVDPPRWQVKLQRPEAGKGFALHGPDHFAVVEQRIVAFAAQRGGHGELGWVLDVRADVVNSRQDEGQRHQIAEIEGTHRRNTRPGHRGTGSMSGFPQPQQGNGAEQQADDRDQQAQWREQQSDGPGPDARAGAKPAKHGQDNRERAQRQSGNGEPASSVGRWVHLGAPPWK